jgi:hypothetical protein
MNLLMEKIRNCIESILKVRVIHYIHDSYLRLVLRHMNGDRM